MRVYAYPMAATDLQEWIESSSVTGWEWNDTNGWVSANQLHHAPPLGYLYEYLLANNFFVSMEPAATLTAPNQSPPEELGTYASAELAGSCRDPSEG